MIKQSAVLPRALIVDDSATMRATLAAFLALAEIEVVGLLSSGRLVLKTIGDTGPDIVCLDYNLPDSNGLELLGAIVAKHPQVAVVMVTGDLNPNVRSAAALAGAAGFIHKPFSQNQIIREVSHILQTRHQVAESGARQANAASTAALTEFSAIIADDSKTMRELLSAILGNLGIFVVAEASNGAIALELVAQHLPSLVCMDVDMPAMNGLDAMREIRQKFPQIKVLMITANAQRAVVMEAYKQGVSGFVVKPFDPAKVRQAITQALKI